jgi:hypothetical protein
MSLRNETASVESMPLTLAHPSDIRPFPPGRRVCDTFVGVLDRAWLQA